MHSQNGTRLGCGLLQRVVPTSGDNRTWTVSTKPLTAAPVNGTATVYTVNDTACYFGAATSLEPNIMSYATGGPDCNVTNGCGVHIHTGTSCYNVTTQEGHIYNKLLYPVDPWKFTSYLATDAKGAAYFTGCVGTGETQFAGRSFIVHSNNGTRVSCGLLSAAAAPAAPVAAPVAAAPVAAAPVSVPVTAPVKPPTGKFKLKGLLRRLFARLFG